MGRLLVVLAILLGLGMVVQASPESLTSLQTRQQQAAQRLVRARQQSRELKRKESSVRGSLAGTRKNLSLTQTRLTVTQTQLTQAQQHLATLQTRLTRLEAQHDIQQAASVERLRYLQRYSSAEQWWTLLLTSTSINDFADRQRQLVRLLSQDRALLVSLQNQTQQVLQVRRAVTAQKATIARIKSQLVSQKDAFQKTALVQTRQLNSLTQQRLAYERTERQLERDTRKLTGIIRRLLEERQRQNPLPNSLGTGRFTMPIPGRLTSNFGWRIHPIFRSRRFHAGVDFAAPIGTLIGAADGGVVIWAGWYGGYGNAVIIDHGEGLATVYGHTSRVLVHVGQRVQKGQKIAAVGSTGVSTGPHLHFEVRKQGQVVNPIPYLH
ncbi:murein hydrolase activator EnvC family protein [Anthocerotibacter panamensis]|uniref:murein hydrolase activator EnvC family protein n=1 Tax=Anthocerotibacter panamensis TaxID=2857077 RepID=UPI001C4083D5|nr:M23 family metallopeptidase [Anthocerotibacter panamensis]